MCKWGVALVLVFLFAVATSCGGNPNRNDSVDPIPTATYEEPSGFIFDRSAYVSDEAFQNCKPLADSLTSRNMIGVLRHSVVYRDGLNNIVRIWQDPRFGVSFRVGDYVFTARHVAGEDPTYSIPTHSDLTPEHRYDFYPVGELFTSRRAPSDFSSGEVFRSGEFLPLRFVYSTEMAADFITFQVENPTSSANPFTHKAAKGLSDFEPLCYFRLFFDSEKKSAEFFIIDGKSLTDERGARELLRSYPDYLKYVVRVFTLYGGWTIGPGASGSPIFLKTGNSYALIGLVYARGNGNIAIGHDIESIREKLIQETQIDIFK